MCHGNELDSRIKLEESGEHSGRCCPSAKDPKLPFAAYEDRFAVLANYDRFKGGRRANVEVHGGASLEEMVVPFIILKKCPNDVEFKFLYANIELKPRIIPVFRLTLLVYILMEIIITASLWKIKDI